MKGKDLLDTLVDQFERSKNHRIKEKLLVLYQTSMIVSNREGDMEIFVDHGLRYLKLAPEYLLENNSVCDIFTKVIDALISQKKIKLAKFVADDFMKYTSAKGEMNRGHHFALCKTWL